MKSFMARLLVRGRSAAASEPAVPRRSRTLHTDLEYFLAAGRALHVGAGLRGAVRRSRRAASTRGGRDDVRVLAGGEAVAPYARDVALLRHDRYRIWSALSGFGSRFPSC